MVESAVQVGDCSRQKDKPHSWESPMQFYGRASMWYHKVTSGGRVERLLFRAGRSQDEELQ